MAGRDPEHRIRVPVMRQNWRDVVFLHWSCPPEAIAPQLPSGFTVDTYDGTAWFALSSFRVDACGLGPFPPLSLWAFPETNLRTYVKGPDGSDGLWFVSIDADTLPVTLGARLLLGAPYHMAAMAVRRDGPDVIYESRRRGDDTVGHDIRVRPGRALEQSERSGLVDWFTGRWRSWTTRLGVCLASPVEHEPWPLHHADLSFLDETISSTANLSISENPLVHYAPGVDARFGAARPHRA